MTARDVRDVLGARVLVGRGSFGGGGAGACGFRYDERCAGIFQGSFCTAYRTMQSAGDPTAEMLDIVCLVFVRGKAR